VSGHFHSPVAISPVKAVLLPNDKEAVRVLCLSSFYIGGKPLVAVEK
jgi:hypothetical protein